MLVGAADHEHVVARHPHVAAEDVGGHAETGDVADVARAVGVRPGDGRQDLAHGWILGGRASAVRPGSGAARRPARRLTPSGRRAPRCRGPSAEPGGRGDVGAHVLEPLARRHPLADGRAARPSRSAADLGAPATTTVISPRTPVGGPLGQLGQPAAADLLVGLGQLAADRRPPVGARTPRPSRPASRRAGAAPRRTPSCGARRPAPRSARRRSPALRGRKPSKQNRSTGSPDTASAISTALGPGTQVTRTPASTAARTSR